MPEIVCYLQIDWNWIRQRPQFLAQQLARYAGVDVLYRRQFHRAGLQRETPAEGVTLHPFYTLPPLRDRFAPLTAANRLLRRQALARLLRQKQPDWLWLTYPSQILEVPEDYRGRIVYDCMDDHLALSCPPALAPLLPQAERRLCARADVILVSSEELRRVLLQRCGAEPGRIHLVRNGFQPFAAAPAAAPPAGAGAGRTAGTFRAGYVGTIAEWFDFPSVLASLERFPQLEYELIGPVRVPEAPQHPRLHYRGTVEHAFLPYFVRDLDLLVMPFADSPIVRAVDPVKLYEYLAFHKNILCLAYPEVERFSSFASLYSGTDSYLSALGAFIRDGRLRYSPAEADAFLAENSWQKRAETVSGILGLKSI